MSAKLTALEWEVMNLVWQHGEQVSVREILNLGYSDGSKAYTTIQTVMNNLVEKRYLKKHKIGLANFYMPCCKKQDIVKTETSSFVKKVYNGSFKALANYLVDSDSLSLEEIKELKRLIAEKEQNTGR